MKQTRWGRIAVLVHGFNQAVDTPSRIPQHICQGIAEAFGCGAVLVLQSEFDPELYPTAAIAHVDPEHLEMVEKVLAAEPVRAGTGIAGGVLATGEPILVSVLDPAALVEHARPEYRQLAREMPTFSVASAPVRAGELVLGALTIFSNRSELRFDEGDLQELGVLADHAGLALRNAELVRALRDELAQRSALEAQRRELETRMQEAQRVESLGALASGVAHDFNNLLVGILGNASLALLELPPEASARNTVGAIELAARRAADLTKQMLAYSGHGRFVIDRIDLSSVVREMGHLVRAALPSHAALKLTLGDDLPLVDADATQVRQVILNLATNASEAMDHAGLVAIRTGTTRVDATYLARCVGDLDLPIGTYAHVEVSDNGRGMDSATQARIFDPFFTTQETGRGLGLAAVRGIARGHRGMLKVTSEPGRGTTVKLLLPPAGGVTDTADPEAGSSDKVVLVADDEETVRVVATKALELRGYRVLTAQDGLDAVQLFERRSGEIDLVILDLTMPRMDGATAFAELRRRDPKVKVLLCSGYSETDVTHRFAGKGLAGFLQKPWSAADLLHRVEEALSRSNR